MPKASVQAIEEAARLRREAHAGSHPMSAEIEPAWDSTIPVPLIDKISQQVQIINDMETDLRQAKQELVEMVNQL